MPTFEQQRYQFIDEHPAPGTDPVARLRHVVEVFSEDVAGDKWAVTATTNMYGKGVTTGLTFGDLRALLARIEAGS